MPQGSYQDTGRAEEAEQRLRAGEIASYNCPVRNIDAARIRLDWCPGFRDEQSVQTCATGVVVTAGRQGHRLRAGCAAGKSGQEFRSRRLGGVGGSPVPGPRCRWFRGRSGVRWTGGQAGQAVPAARSTACSHTSRTTSACGASYARCGPCRRARPPRRAAVPGRSAGRSARPSPRTARREPSCP